MTTMQDIGAANQHYKALKSIYKNFADIVVPALKAPPTGEKITDPQNLKEAGAKLTALGSDHARLVYSLADAALDTAEITRERVSLLLTYPALSACVDHAHVITALESGLEESVKLIQASALWLDSAHRYDPQPDNAKYQDHEDRQNMSREQFILLAKNKLAFENDPADREHFAFPHRHPDDPAKAFVDVTARLSDRYTQIAKSSLERATHNMTHVGHIMDVIRPNVPADYLPQFDARADDLLGEGAVALNEAIGCLGNAFKYTPPFEQPA